jgi:phosphoglycerol transferase
MKKNKIISLIAIILLILSTFIFSVSNYLSEQFSDQNIDEMIFYLVSGTNGAANDVFISAIQTTLIPFLLILLFLLIPIIRFKNRKNIIELKIKNKKMTFSINLFFKYRLIYATVILLTSLITLYQMLGMDNYFKRLANFSTLVDHYYVNGSDVSFTFPKEKRNLIILYVESLENSIIAKENGGGWKYSVIPELENIAEKNVNFSNSDKIGGALPITGTGWTVGGLVSTTSGLPLNIPVNGNEYTSSSKFLAGAYTLGDVLKKEGYNLEFMAGSDSKFGGRKNYYTKHGNYKIFDVNTAIQQGKMLKNEHVWWGFDDTHLFNWAKEEIISLAGSKKPFSFSFLTANTHFPDGYLEKKANKKFDSQYENVYAYSSIQIAEFVNWLQKQDFYKNTTLVILGDHLSMQPDGFFPNHVYKGYNRTIYNAFINPSNDPVNSENRKFSSLDIYPTLLASIGAEIKGNRLGLGTNLFSGRKTLEEELGFSYVNTELAKNSNFYNQYILQDDYLKLLMEAKKGKDKVQMANL